MKILATALLLFSVFSVGRSAKMLDLGKGVIEGYVGETKEFDECTPSLKLLQYMSDIQEKYEYPEFRPYFDTLSIYGIYSEVRQLFENCHMSDMLQGVARHFSNRCPFEVLSSLHSEGVFFQLSTFYIQYKQGRFEEAGRALGTILAGEFPNDPTLKLDLVSPIWSTGDLILGLIEGLQTQPKESSCLMNFKGILYAIDTAIQTFENCFALDELACSEVSEHTMVLVNGVRGLWTDCKIEDMVNAIEETTDLYKIDHFALRLLKNYKLIAETFSDLEQVVTSDNPRNKAKIIGNLARSITGFSLN